MTHLSDPELVRRTLQGDTTAFGTLVERYKQVVYGVWPMAGSAFHALEVVSVSVPPCLG